MSHLENGIAIKNDYTNNQFLCQFPLTDDKIVIPIQGGDWYAIKLRNSKLFKINLSTSEETQITSSDITVNYLTFDYDSFNKQLRITLDLSAEEASTTRISMVIHMLNVVNEL